MSDGVCGYCGKANGWHLFGCPEMKLTFPSAVMMPDDDYGDPIPIAKLPEVE